MHMNSWINPDGWNTEAYITALTYSDDKQALQHRPSRISSFVAAASGMETVIRFTLS
ncbi:hypothetical protein [Duncaniella muris]|nr:hypothetical protein [Duncaniella muris]